MTNTTQKPTILSAFGNRRTAAVLALGFSSGVPLALTGATLQAWMKTENVDLTVIGLFSLVGIPYTLKFLWAPLMDRFVPPFLGRRRGWMLISQLLLVLGVIALAFSDPARFPALTATICLGVAFFSSSQDIVIDAYRTEILEKDETGPGAALYIMGYRIAVLVSGAVALILADHMPWKLVYLIMACTMGVGILTSFLAPDPKVPAKPPKSIGDAVVLPFVEFFKRRGAVEILAFIVLYKLDVVVAQALMTPFLMDLGFTKTDIGTVTKGFGLVATILGTLFGGAMLVKLGMLRSLWFFGLLQGLAGFSFMTLARLGHHYPMMVTAIAVENICSGMGTAAFAAFMMSICDKRYTATQYALLTSLMAITRVMGSALTGYMAKAWGWELYYLASILVAIPGLLLLLRYSKWTTVAADGTAEPAVVGAK
ncbi:MAG: AmpG family muropeptide MFS transporter [Oligoflexia bacterium]|nr:AmpG family muropeptide MFS transporter [Oligoflexia bacterium]